MESYPRCPTDENRTRLFLTDNELPYPDDYGGIILVQRAGNDPAFLDFQTSIHPSISSLDCLEGDMGNAPIYLLSKSSI